MEGANPMKKKWVRRCNECDVGFSYKQSYVLHLVGKRHQKNVKKRTSSQVKAVRNRTVCFSGKRDKITLENIVGYFLEYGVTNVVQQGNTVSIEFDTVEAANIVLKKRDYRICTTFLRVFPTKPDDEGPKVVISPYLRNCMSQAVTGSELDKHIDFLIKEIELKPSEIEARQNLRRGIVKYLSPYFPKVVGHIFGSAANNLGFTGCDVDIYLDLGVYPWRDCENKVAAQAEASDITWFLTRTIRRSGYAIKVEPVPRARVPIVKFQDRSSKIMVDLSFRHGMPVYNTQLIYQYTQTHVLVRPYLMIIRYWAKVQDVAGGGKPTFLITNYALTMMMLFYLMYRIDPIVPSVSSLRNNSSTYTPVFIGPWDVGFSNNIREWCVKVHNVNTMDLVSEFFLFYGKLDASQWVISPLTGMLLTRKDVETMSRNLPECFNTYLQQDDKLQLNTELCVQDPFEHNHNCTRGLEKNYFLEFQTKCRRAASISENILKGEQTLNDLFQAIEVTPEVISDVSQDSSQLKEDDEVITLDDSDMSQDIEVLDFKKILPQDETVLSNSEETSDVEILSVAVKTPDSEILSDPQDATQDVIIVTDSQDNTLITKNHTHKSQEELESSNKVIDQNERRTDLSTKSEGSGVSQRTVEDSSSTSSPLVINHLGVCSTFLLDFSQVPEFMVSPDGNIHRKGSQQAENYDTGQAACIFIQFILQQCLKVELSIEEDSLTNGKRKVLLQGDEKTTEKKRKDNDGNIAPVSLKYLRLTKYLCTARVDLWIGRKKISKTVPKKVDEDPLQYELAVTETQLQKYMYIYLPDSDSLRFSIEVWQELNNPKIIHVTGNSLSDTKKTRAQMIPMFSYFTSLCQNVLRRMTHYITTSRH